MQRLTGRGFSRMPTALEQGHLHPSVLKSAAAKWGLQLHTAGVNLDLAPVADTVPAKHASSNQPIGQFDREFGHRPPVVAAHAVAFLRGMNAAGVDATVKHFPGLGRATGNTDTSRHVTDPTTAHDRYLLPFRKAIRAGAEFVMVSSATYPRIDKHDPACFSARVMTTLLRGELNFRGAVISDDLGVTALSRTPVRARAVRFFAAGGTMLLDTSLSQIPGMIRAVLAKQRAHTAFARTIKQAVMTDLTAKANAGLL